MIILLLLCIITLSASVLYTRCSRPRALEGVVEYSMYNSVADSVNGVSEEVEEREAPDKKATKRTGKKGRKKGSKKKPEKIMEKAAPRDFMRDTVGRN